MKCDETGQWKKNESAIMGTSLQAPRALQQVAWQDCCIPLFCTNYTCTPASEWEKNPHAVLGSSPLGVVRNKSI